ncbi:MAG: hypothetical protein JXX28_09540 [Deltaproteobacteria bacterium]|nr:hypothetical protein [Deltaproteobacteria bacterium]
MRASLPALLALALAACGGGGQIALQIDDLSLELDRPVYGEFVGDGPIEVSGRVSRPGAHVYVEGERVLTDADGRFTAQVPADAPYRIIDVGARLYGAAVKERVPVFRGHDPVETWPGGMTLRVGPEGLDHLGAMVGGMVDQMGWEDQLMAAFAPIDAGSFSLTPVGLRHLPTEVELIPAEEGMDAILSFKDLTLEMILDVPDLGYSAPITVGWAEVNVGSRVIPWVDEEALVFLTVGDPIVDWVDPVLTVEGAESDLLALLLEAVSWLVEPVLEAGLGLIFDNLGELALGGPYAFEQDMMGTPLALRLTDLYGDTYGLGGELGLGLGAAALVEHPDLPVPTDLPAGADAAIALHEGLFQVLIGQLGVLDMLSQELTLSGTMGDLVGMGITALPGGDQVDEGDGWCLQLEPGTAWVTRLQTGLDPLASIYLPDFQVSVAPQYGRGCGTWLSASLAVELGLNVRNGTAIGVDLTVHEGAVLSYEAAEGTWDEDEVIEGLGQWVESTVGLLAGSMLQFDLADLFGGQTAMLGATQLSLVDSRLMEEGPEGLAEISLSLWGE